MITKRQSDVLRAIRNHQVTQGHTPTYEEIAAACGVRSLATVHKHLHNLEDGGFVTFRHHNMSRSTQITAMGISVLDGDGRDVKLRRDFVLDRLRFELDLPPKTDMNGESPLLRIRTLWNLVSKMATVVSEDRSTEDWCKLCDGRQDGSDTIQHKPDCILKGMPTHG